jgi:hypothetical protein
MESTDDPDCNGSLLVVSLNRLNGSPIDLGRLALAFRGTKGALSGRGSFVRNEGSNTVLGINWPLMFREQVQTMQDRDTANVSLSDS